MFHGYPATSATLSTGRRIGRLDRYQQPRRGDGVLFRDAALDDAHSGMGIRLGAPCTALTHKVARSAENDFTSQAMQRGILLGVIVIVLLEGAGARSGG